jgi:hypothetical protein
MPTIHLKFRNAFFKKKSLSSFFLNKIIIPNPLSNPQAIPLLEKSSQIMKKEVILLLMFVFFYTNTNAQISVVGQQNDAVVVAELKSVGIDFKEIEHS